MFVHILRPAQMFPLLYSVGKIAGKCDVTHFSDGSGCLNAYFLRIKTAVSRASHGTKGVFCIAPFFVAIPLFGIGVRSNHRLTFPYSKPCAVRPLEAGLFKKIRPVNTVPAGTFEGWRFF